jgi:hypothetical protein
MTLHFHFSSAAPILMLREIGRVAARFQIVKKPWYTSPQSIR